MDELGELRFWWFPLAVWIATVALVVWNGFLLGRYRREGLLPAKSIRRDLDILFGRYDHLPHLRMVRRTSMILMGVFCSSALALVATK